MSFRGHRRTLPYVHAMSVPRPDQSALDDNAMRSLSRAVIASGLAGCGGSQNISDHRDWKSVGRFLQIKP